jgi:23S rRNA pseudouridine1911/1915/1917 synthase
MNDTTTRPDEAARSELTVTEAEAGTRLDRLLADRLPAFSRSRLKALILAEAVTIDGRLVVDPGARVNSGASIVLDVPPPEDPTPAPERIPLAIVHEDADLIVIDKPAGLVVHPAPGSPAGTLVNALIAHCGASLSGIGGVARPGIVHRLDKDTSGVMVVAKTDRAHRRLAAQFADHGRTGDLTRSYLAFVWGVPALPSGSVDAPLDRDPRNREKIAVRANGRWAVTHWRLIESYAGSDGRPVASLVECRLETGRTHQIRVHMAHIGHPLLGDAVYGAGFRTKAAQLPEAARSALDRLGRQALHAASLGFVHTSSQEFMEFASELPEDLAALRRSLAQTPARKLTKA